MNSVAATSLQQQTASWVGVNTFLIKKKSSFLPKFTTCRKKMMMRILVGLSTFQLGPMCDKVLRRSVEAPLLNLINEMEELIIHCSLQSLNRIKALNGRFLLKPQLKARREDRLRNELTAKRDVNSKRRCGCVFTRHVRTCFFDFTVFIRRNLSFALMLFAPGSKST